MLSLVATGGEATPAQATKLFGTVGPEFTITLEDAQVARVSQLDPGAYEIEVYKDNDDKWSPLNRVISRTIRTSAFANDKPLPPSALPYVWRVRRIDPKSPNSEQHKAPWSTPGRFTVTAEPFELLAPAPVTITPTPAPRPAARRCCWVHWTSTAPAAPPRVACRRPACSRVWPVSATACCAKGFPCRRSCCSNRDTEN